MVRVRAPFGFGFWIAVLVESQNESHHRESIPGIEKSKLELELLWKERRVQHIQRDRAVRSVLCTSNVPTATNGHWGNANNSQVCQSYITYVVLVHYLSTDSEKELG